nr:putative reverse transcriptase domain-containing protein [Tanacetum cinerariifolium]
QENRGSKNGHDSYNSGSGGRRHVPTARVCTYKDFLNCQPFNFKGTEGVIGLTQWFEKMEYVFHINSCTVGNQVKEREAMHTPQAWSHAMDCNKAKNGSKGNPMSDVAIKALIA